MRVLVIGGTRFVGIHIVNSLIENGHDVTLFNRGKTNPDIFNNVPLIKGDRVTDLNLLDGMDFDAVIDPGCYFPYQLKVSLNYFKDKIKFYVFISTVAVQDLSVDEIVEDTPTLEPDFDSTKFNEDSSNYGTMKAAMEIMVRDAMGEGRYGIIRPGYICGSNDGTDRFTYWPMKMHFNDVMVLPEGDFQFQFVDVKDLGDFTALITEEQNSGIFNVTGNNMKFSSFLNECSEAVNPKIKLVRLSKEDLTKYEINKYAAFPLFIDDIKEYKGIYNCNCTKAVNAGLKFRPVKSTIKDALDWFLSVGKTPETAAVGLKPEKEKEILSEIL